MSINDLMKMDLVPIVLLLLLIAFFVYMYWFIKIKTSTKGEIKERNAKVLSKRIDSRKVFMNNIVLFEFDDGSRVRLAVWDKETYFRLIEGDYGILRYRVTGNFISFKVIKED